MSSYNLRSRSVPSSGEALKAHTQAESCAKTARTNAAEMTVPKSSAGPPRTPSPRSKIPSSGSFARSAAPSPACSDSTASPYSDVELVFTPPPAGAHSSSSDTEDELSTDPRVERSTRSSTPNKQSDSDISGDSPQEFVQSLQKRGKRPSSKTCSQKVDSDYKSWHQLSGSPICVTKSQRPSESPIARPSLHRHSQLIRCTQVSGDLLESQNARQCSHSHSGWTESDTAITATVPTSGDPLEHSNTHQRSCSHGDLAESDNIRTHSIQTLRDSPETSNTRQRSPSPDGQTEPDIAATASVHTLPQFVAYFKADNIDCKREVDEVLRKIERKEIKAKKESGYVYVARRADIVNHLKIGSTKRTARERLPEESRDCGREHVEIIDESGVPVKYCGVVEKLVHAHLCKYRRKFQCEGCSRTHNEWFEVNEETALNSVRLWQGWIRKCSPLFGEPGQLSSYWSWKLEHLKSEPSGADTPGICWEKLLAERTWLDCIKFGASLISAFAGAVQEYLTIREKVEGSKKMRSKLGCLVDAFLESPLLYLIVFALFADNFRIRWGLFWRSPGYCDTVALRY